MTKFSHNITAALGAILMSAMFIGAAAGPGAVSAPAQTTVQASA